ncbi:MAG: hypothetical protein AAB316_18155, partial [Bacteroidota bacterium]
SMEISEKYKLNFNLSDHQVLDVLDFTHFPILTVEANPTGFNYVSYLVEFTRQEGLEQRISIPVSTGKLEALKSGKISVKELFDNSELGQVYCLFYDENSGETISTYLIPLDDFRKINPIPKDYQISTVALS